ncbi:hypothetical protein L6R52_32845 [Myxococcota bacterium]|nr:hypothetical protein [Myxococcota bacterium]
MADTSAKKTRTEGGTSPRCVIVPGDLAALDARAIDALAILAFAAKVQPLGLAGLVDWRLSGRIARLVRSGRFTGALGDAVLTPSLDRIGAERIFVLGLGAPEKLDDAARTRITGAVIETLAGAGARAVALGAPVLPARFGFSSDDGVAIVEAFVAGSARFTEVVLFDVDGSLAKARDRLAAAAKRAGLALEA